MTKNLFLTAFAAATLLMPAAAFADTVVYNGTPADTWDNYGSGNDYNPANTAVLTTNALDQLYLRSHVTYDTAPASVGKDYNFTTGAGKQISVDWGIDTSNWTGVTALITLQKYGGGGSYSFDPLATPDNRPPLDGSIQNSFRMNWFAGPLAFTPDLDSSYNVKLDVFGLAGGTKSLNIDVNMGAGGTGAIPEPGTWALMILGFGGTGAMLRTRRKTLALAA